jgi:hypothetical protein
MELFLTFDSVEHDKILREYLLVPTVLLFHELYDFMILHAVTEFINRKRAE